MASRRPSDALSVSSHVVLWRWYRQIQTMHQQRLGVFGGLCVDMWQLVHQWSFFCCFDCLLTVFDDWYTVGTVLVDMWRLVHQWSSLLFWLSFDCFWLLLTVFDDWYTVGTVLVNMWRLVQQWSFLLFWLSFDCFWLLVYQSLQVYQDCTNSVPTVYQSSKTVKTAKMTIGVPIVTCLHGVLRIRKVRVPRPRLRPPYTQSLSNWQRWSSRFSIGCMARIAT